MTGYLTLGLSFVISKSCLSFFASVSISSLLFFSRSKVFSSGAFRAAARIGANAALSLATNSTMAHLPSSEV